MNLEGEMNLYIPKLEELDFYQSLISDPDTMSYNATWYTPNGCIVLLKKNIIKASSSNEN